GRAIDEAKRWAQRRNQRAAAAKADAEEGFPSWLTQQVTRVERGYEPWQSLPLRSVESLEGTLLTQEDDGAIQASGPTPRQDDYQIIAHTLLPKITGLRLDVLPHESHTDGKWTRGETG